MLKRISSVTLRLIHQQRNKCGIRPILHFDEGQLNGLLLADCWDKKNQHRIGTRTPAPFIISGAIIAFRSGLASMSLTRNVSPTTATGII